MYHFVWRNVSAHDVSNMIASVIVSYALTTIMAYLMHNRQPRSVQFMQLVFEMILLVGSRCTLRFWEAIRLALRQSRSNYDERILLVGAGEAGRILAYAYSSYIAARARCYEVAFVK